MNGWNKEFLERLKKERPNYSDMIDYCCDSLVLNNDILPILSDDGYYFDTYCGTDCWYEDAAGNQITYDEYNELIDDGMEAYEHYEDIYQYYIISRRDAERLEEFTNEYVVYCEKLDLYLLCVTHWGTAWSGVPANWKDEIVEEDENE